MTVYLLHLDEPLSPNHTSQHYMGYADDDNLLERLEKHRHNPDARYMQVVKERGIDWHLVRIWPGDRSRERQLKKQSRAPHLCPICSVKRFGEVPF